MSDSRDRMHGSVPDRATSALLVLDMFSDFSFPGGARAARLALPVARRIASLKARLARRKVPCLYVNDNLGRWRSDFPALLRRAAAARGAPLVRLLRPQERDYCILKPKHSGFFDTPLDTILEALRVRRLILCGTMTPQCILFTATDAYVRDYELVVPSDCVLSLTRREQQLALYFLRSVLGARVCRAGALRH
ncbi:MAG: cysteine hydrolase [Gammaproteobacteria bacterium]|nr:cysteine hydrolase [Gammaproteobacteria bacterium]MBV9695764.1 cysteine hydrolase [Gammaproteobacteria bacterium]